MKPDRESMMFAIEEAKKSVEGVGCGAVIVDKAGNILSRSHNKQMEMSDASAHAEINAIRKAGKELKNKYLDGCIIYCTCEPCIMCVAAISYARISTIVYGMTLRKVFPKERIFDFDMNDIISRSSNKIIIVKNFMEKECAEVLAKDMSYPM